MAPFESVLNYGIERFLSGSEQLTKILFGNSRCRLKIVGDYVLAY
jgi:hypothetical protein